MKKTKPLIIVVLCAVVLGIGGSVVYSQFISNNNKKDNNSVQNDEIKTVIHESQVMVTLEDGIKESDLVVEVEILGIDREAGGAMPQTIHVAQIVEIYSGGLSVGDIIYVIQDGVEDMIISGIPIYQAGEKYIFTLNAAEPIEAYPDTYWATKIYFSADGEVIDLNYGGPEFDEILDSNSANVEVQEKLNEVVNEMFTDKVNIQIIEKSVVLDKIAEIIGNEED